MWDIPLANLRFWDLDLASKHIVEFVCPTGIAQICVQIERFWAHRVSGRQCFAGHRWSTFSHRLVGVRFLEQFKNKCHPICQNQIFVVSASEKNKRKLLGGPRGWEVFILRHGYWWFGAEEPTGVTRVLQIHSSENRHRPIRLFVFFSNDPYRGLKSRSANVWLRRLTLTPPTFSCQKLEQTAILVFVFWDNVTCLAFLLDF